MNKKQTHVYLLHVVIGWGGRIYPSIFITKVGYQDFESNDTDKKKKQGNFPVFLLAGAEGFEPTITGLPH